MYSFVTKTACLLLMLGQASLLAACGQGGELIFDNVEAQTAEFMRYYEEIELSPEQTAVMTEALTALPAPCCSDRTAATCCCECNMARSWWGLSKHLITEHDYDAVQLKAKVSEWFEYINPGGSAGDSCYKGRCFKAFHQDGCGGMKKTEVIF